MSEDNSINAGSIPHRKYEQFQNFGHNIHFSPEETWEPSTVEELQQIVKDASKQGKKIRVAGSTHSWSPLWYRGKDKDGWIVKMTKFKKVKQYKNPQGALLVTVGAGVTVGELVKDEIQQRYCIPASVLVTGVTMAGVVSTGCRGTGYHEPLVSDYLYSISMVLSDGTKRTFTTENGEIFEAAKISLGLFGIIYKMTFRVEPMPVVRVKDMKLKIEDVFDRKDPSKLREIVTSYDHTEFLWFPLNYQGVVWVKTFNRSEGHDPQNTPCDEWEKNLIGFFSVLYSRFVDFAENKLDPRTTPKFASEFVAALDTQDTYQDLSYAIHYQANLSNLPPTCNVEVVMKIEDNFSNVVNAFLDVVQKTKQEAANGKFPLNLAFGLKCLGRSTALLAPNYSTDPADHFAFIEFESYTDTPGFHDFTRSILIPWMQENPKWQVKPHWPKNWQMLNNQSFKIDRYIRDTYQENLVKFTEIRDQLDPGKMFLNHDLERLFYPPTEELKHFHEVLGKEIDQVESQLKEVFRQKHQLSHAT